jgi:site-specific DNA-adenine methylase
MKVWVAHQEVFFAAVYLKNEVSHIGSILILSCVLFFFLSKRGVSGLNRVSKRSGFNTSFQSDLNKPFHINRDDLLEFSRLVQRLTFVWQDFRAAFSQVTSGDYVYADPPYLGCKNQIYTPGDFKTMADHDTLFSLCKGLESRGAEGLMSNYPSVYLLDVIYKTPL